jgi:hypothetical protein
MAQWLAAQEEVFADWAASTGRPGDFDFTPASLDALEEVLRSRLAGLSGGRVFELYKDPIFYGALWYLGEVICRSCGARWMPMRANLNVTLDRLNLLTVARVGHRIGPQTELTSVIHHCIRGIRYPDDSYQPIRHVLDDYRQCRESLM